MNRIPYFAGLVLLLLLAPGLYRRLDGAFVATRALLLAGAAFSLAKGIDYEEAIACLTLAAMLQWTRGAFYRRTALTQIRWSAGWLSAVLVVLAAAVWIGLFAYRRVPYDDDLWWHFALKGDAPRFLRATLAATVALLVALVWRWMSPPAAPEPRAFAPQALAHVVALADRTDAAVTPAAHHPHLEEGTAHGLRHPTLR